MNDPLLVASAIHKTYVMGRAGLRVLRGCDLRMADGELVAIMGKSGSGKSTLLHILGALDVPQEGNVLFRGQEIFAPPGQRRLRTGITDILSAAERHRIHLRRTQFGFVFQFYYLLPELNVLENVLIARMIDSSVWEWWRSKRHAARTDALSIIERVGLGERIKHRPRELSGGERQRLAIARALVHKPRVLFADEPTGNLDAEAGANIMSLLKGLHDGGQTIVMVTHDPSVAAYADRILLLEDGNLHAA
ncbi:MAG: ABC transporter ATP-binding protein [Planctomycetes bacterium]|nr:ABC transporter ATP-binding protein [Planctomycetota bacterium]